MRVLRWMVLPVLLLAGWIGYELEWRRTRREAEERHPRPTMDGTMEGQG